MDEESSHGSDVGGFSSASYNSNDEDLCFTENSDEEDLGLKGRFTENPDLAHSVTLMDDAKLLNAEYEDILKMTFVSEEEGYNFFNDYAKGKGFSIRRGKLRKSETGSLFFHQFLCSWEGFQRKFFSRPDQKRRVCVLTQCVCPVEFCIKLDWSTGEWCVAKFVSTHNHMLAAPDKACFLRSHWKIKDSTRFAGLTMHQILNVLKNENGGYENVGLVPKDLCNLTHRKKITKVHLDDAKTVLSRMRERKESDPDFFYKHKVDADGHLTHLFWSDSQSRLDYGYFGDVLLFDSTCCVNRYNMPIIPFLGLSNHQTTVTFGCGIVTDDSVDSYEWLLSTLMEAIHQKCPTSIITDGDHAMCEAVKAVLGDITHRWSTWHVDQNIASNLKPPSSSALKSLVHTEFALEEFEDKWKELIGSNDAFKDNNWLRTMYECKHFWAAAFVQKRTFLGLKSNQENNSFCKYLDRNISLLDIVEHYDHILARTRRHESEIDSKAFKFIPVTTTDFDLQKHAASIYTPKIFYIVQSEIMKTMEHEVIKIVVGEQSRTYILAVERQEDDFVSMECVGSPKIKRFLCSCQKLECEQVPCSHILAVLIDMKVNCIPQCCVRERWSKNAKHVLPSNEREMKMFRDLSNLSGKIVHLASKSGECYLEMREVLSKMLEKFEQVEYVDVQDRYVDEENNVKSKEACSSDKSRDLLPVISDIAIKEKIKSFFNEKKKYKCGDNVKSKEACSSDKTRYSLPVILDIAIKEKIKSFYNEKRKYKCGFCE